MPSWPTCRWPLPTRSGRFKVGRDCMIADDLRRTLVDIIFRAPIAQSHPGRTGLLAGIPNSGLFTRNDQNPLGDVTVLVTQLEEIYGPNREWRLLQFIDNVASSIPNTELQTNLLSIRVQLQTSGRASKLNP